MRARLLTWSLTAALAGCQGVASPKMNNLVPPGETEADAGAPSEPTPKRDAAPGSTPDTAPPRDLAPDLMPDLPPPPDADPVWARNVKVGLVEVAQAVFIEIGNGAEVKATLDRNAPLIEGRAAFLRAHVVTGADWVPRRLRAVLTLELDGKSTAFDDTRMIDGPSDTEKLESSFNFLLPAVQLKPRTELSVSIYETGPAMGPEPATPPRFPPTGTADLGVKGGKMVMDVVMVLVTGPSGALDDSPPRRKRLENYLADVYPVQKMTVRWRDPIKITAKMGWMDAFMMLQKARVEDDAKPAEYYHMLMAKEDSLDGFLGLGRIAGPAASEAANRIAMTNVSKHAVDGEMDTVSHEMGHNLGRNHAPGCKAQGVDERYPYLNTGIGVDGYSLGELASGKDHLPNAPGPFKPKSKFKDVMGYCYPTWISDYTWNGFERRARVVSAYSETMPYQPLLARALQGFQAPGTGGRWGVVRGTLVGDQPVTAQRQARLTLRSGEVRIVPIDVSLLRSPAGPEASARQLSVDLPDEEVTAVEVLVDGERLVVPTEALER